MNERDAVTDNKRQFLLKYSVQSTIFSVLLKHRSRRRMGREGGGEEGREGGREKTRRVGRRAAEIPRIPGDNQLK